MLNTRVSVRTSCLRNFGQGGLELNQKKSVEEFFFPEVLPCVKLEKNFLINFNKFIWFY